MAYVYVAAYGHLAGYTVDVGGGCVPLRQRQKPLVFLILQLVFLINFQPYNSHVHTWLSTNYYL